MNIPMYSALSMLVYGKALYKNIIIIIIIILFLGRHWSSLVIIGRHWSSSAVIGSHRFSDVPLRQVCHQQCDLVS